MQNDTPITTPNSALQQQYAPQISLKVERLAKGFNLEATAHYCSSPEEADRLVAETLALAMPKYPSAADLAAQAVKVVPSTEGK